MCQDNIPLLQKKSESGLSLFFATLCIVDIFGVFPIITLPRSIVECGWLGIPLVLIVFGFQIYTAILLGKSWDLAVAIDPDIVKNNRYPLAAVTELALGERTSFFVSILSDVTLFGGGIPNLLVASQNLQLFGLKVSQQEFNVSFCYWLLIIGLLLCPVMWLGSPRDMKLVAVFSTLAVFITALLVWWAILMDNRDIYIISIPTSSTWEKFISGYGMLAFQFDVHPTVMTIQIDMKKSRDIKKAVIYSFIISGLLFVITTSLAVWRYGADTSANLFQVLPPGGMVQIAVLIAALQLCLSSAIGHAALFQHIEDCIKLQRSFGWKRVALRSSIVLLGVALGESVPRFDIVMALIGGTLTGPLIFILPPLIYNKLHTLQLKRLQSISVDEFYVNRPKKLNIKSNENSDNSENYSSEKYTDNEKFDIYYDNINNIEVSYYIEKRNFLNKSTYSSKKSFKIFESSRNKISSIMIHPKQPYVWITRLQEVLNININKLKQILTINQLLKWFGYGIILSGLLITGSSTYINIRNTVRFVKFIPPCIINSTYLPNLN